MVLFIQLYGNDHHNDCVSYQFSILSFNFFFCLQHQHNFDLLPHVNQNLIACEWYRLNDIVLSEFFMCRKKTNNNKEKQQKNIAQKSKLSALNVRKFWFHVKAKCSAHARKSHVRVKNYVSFSLYGSFLCSLNYDSEDFCATLSNVALSSKK